MYRAFQYTFLDSLEGDFDFRDNSEQGMEHKMNKTMNSKQEVL